MLPVQEPVSILTHDPVTLLWHHFNKRNWYAAKQLLAPNFVAEWPQTRERIKGADNFIELNSHYPGQWQCQLKKNISYSENKRMSLVIITNGTNIFYATSFYTLDHDKITHALEFFAENSAPPYNRAQWVEYY
ncbi:MAG: hypothetical protein K1X44_08150 [Alphaproteobacteria bacterium]|nr:hypothetical protein [Alphaproteobacteria bacterium]